MSDKKWDFKTRTYITWGYIFKTLMNLYGSVFRSQTWIPEEGDFQNSSLALIKYSGICEVFWSKHSK